MSNRPLIACFALVLAAGCSALVSPDEGRLGGGGDAATDSRTGDAFDSGPADSGDAAGDTGPDDSGDAGDGGGGCPGGCNDGVGCTIDRCMSGTCVSTPRDMVCPSGEICDPVLGCTTVLCENDGECDDGAFCNGMERCDAGDPSADARGCVAGDPVVCDDGMHCTRDACDEDADICTAIPDDALCGDGIDCSTDACRPGARRRDAEGCVYTEDDSLCVSADFCTVGQECNITASGCIGGSPRDCRDGDFCTADSCDSAAGMCINASRDSDGDGYAASMVGGTACPGGTDCDDSDPSVNPGATELCNGRDDNCNFLVDESCTPIPDTCADAEPISVVVGGPTITITGRLDDYDSDYDTICGSSGARDAVYYVDVTSNVDLTIDTIGSRADTVVAVSVACGMRGFNRLGCNDDIDGGANLASRVWVHRFGPPSGRLSARLYILVDGYQASTTGSFVLNVSATAFAPDTCVAPIDISGGGSLVGFVAPAALLPTPITGSCQGPGDSMLYEAIARVDGDPDGTAAFDVYSNGFDPDLYLRSDPCGTGTELACVAGDGSAGSLGFNFSTRLESTVTAGAAHYLFVDGVSVPSAYFVSYQP